MKHTIEELDGYLHVVSDWGPGYADPVERRFWFPTGVRASEWQHIIGQEAHAVSMDYNGGHYVVRARGSLCGEVHVFLRDRGKTIAAKVEERSIPKPRAGKKYNWIWSSGEWTKINK